MLRFSILKMLSLGVLVLSIRSKIGQYQSVRYSGASKPLRNCQSLDWVQRTKKFESLCQILTFLMIRHGCTCARIPHFICTRNINFDISAVQFFVGANLKKSAWDEINYNQPRRQPLRAWAFVAQLKNKPFVWGFVCVCVGAQKIAKSAEKLKKISFSQKQFFTILNGIGEVWGCPGGGHGPYEDIVSNFGRVWSYRTWGKSIFMFLGNIGNSLHHQIPPNGSSGLQIGPRILFKARVPSQKLSNKLIFPKKTPRKIQFPGNWATSQNRYFL